MLSPVSCQALSTQASFTSTVLQDPTTGTSGLLGASEEGSSVRQPVPLGHRQLQVAAGTGWGSLPCLWGVPAAGAAPGVCSAFQHGLPAQGLGAQRELSAPGGNARGLAIPHGERRMLSDFSVVLAGRETALGRPQGEPQKPPSKEQGAEK